jgi:hypothetical protein
LLTPCQLAGWALTPDSKIGYLHRLSRETGILWIRISQAGGHQDYIIKTLSDYRSGKRTNPIMANFAA